MKKYLFSLLFLFIFLFAGCKTINVPLKDKKKPAVFYYTNELSKNINNQATFNCTIMDTNLYKEKTLDEQDIKIILSFLTILNKNDFVSTKVELPSKPIYKMFLTFDKAKFVINVYNEKYISLYPWDGEFPPDIIDMNNINASNNLYHLCRYIISSQIKGQ